MPVVDEMEMRKAANPLGEPVIQINPEQQYGRVGSLLGFRAIDDNDEQMTYPVKPFLPNRGDFDHVYVTECNGRGVLVIGRCFKRGDCHENRNEVLSFLTKEGEADNARLIIANAMRDTIAACATNVNKPVSHLIDIPTIRTDVTEAWRFEHDFMPPFGILSVFWLVPPKNFLATSIALSDFRDQAIYIRYFGLQGRIRNRLKADMKG